ncbi:TPA: hypothetical protein R1902_000294 [Staphylococcus delphini]|nr:hypothetical protein [Staphylococcus delphini]HEC2147301.1 hypothetical protein [Staphylococcus delphini]HEC2149703.1 hypothetical protein [Staphylococcus delphini]HEC2159331.1 hypothetical protein [Staphylococcus delphini]HEC2168841.1 hypothetical protein [Staphylococcus delphini]
MIHHQNYKTRNEAMFSIVEYLLTFYNSKSVHSTLNDMSPVNLRRNTKTHLAKRDRILYFPCLDS